MRFSKAFGAFLLGYAVGGVLGILFATNAKAAEAPAPAPLSAIAVSQCGSAISFFVQLDATHLLRADAKQTVIFTAQPDGTFTESKSDPMKFEDIYKLALTARLQSHVVVQCVSGNPAV